MGQNVSYPEDKHIVVVGGGFAGIALCTHLLDHKANFTLIDSRDAFHYNVASVRAIVVPELVDQILMPYSQTFGSHFRHGKMTGIDTDRKAIKLEDGEEVMYDIIVLAVGTTGQFPSKMGHVNTIDAIQLYKNYADKIQSAKNIVIVGGGAVGVEIAGEIATECPDKNVTLVHSGDRLVWNYLTDSFQKKVRDALKQLGVEVILGEKVLDLNSYEDNLPCDIRTDKGNNIPADLLIPTIGLTVNSDAYTDGLGKCVDERDAVRINHYLQVEGYPDIFAMGDCCASGDAWTAYLAMEHAKIVAKNIANTFTGNELIKYKNSTPFHLILTIGRNYTFGELKNGWPIPAWYCTYVKGDLMVARFRGLMRQN